MKTADDVNPKPQQDSTKIETLSVDTRVTSVIHTNSAGALKDIPVETIVNLKQEGLLTPHNNSLLPVQQQLEIGTIEVKRDITASIFIDESSSNPNKDTSNPTPFIHNQYFPNVMVTVNPKRKNYSLSEILQVMHNHFQNRLAKDVLLMQALHYYIKLDVTAQPYSENTLALDEQIGIFMSTNNQSPLLLIQGDTGLGKSTFLNKLAQEQWDVIRRNIGQKTYLPILIEFKTYKIRKGDYFNEFFKEEYGLKDEEISELKKHFKFLLLLDGYDELNDVNNLPLDRLFEGLDNWDLKIMVTCRTLYLNNIPSYRLIFNLSKNHNVTYLEEYWMAAFNQAKVDLYLQKYVQIAKPRWTLQQFRKSIADIPAGLINNPLLLRLIVELLPDLDQASLKYLTKAEIYKKSIANWFNREGKRIIDIEGKLPSRDFSSDRYFGDFAESLAFQMFIATKDKFLTEVDYKPAEQKRSSKYGTSINIQLQEVWDKFFKNDDIDKARKLAGCPLLCINNKYSFYHRSFQEYFTAAYFYHDLGLGEEDDENFNLALANLEKTDFNLKLISEESEIAQFFAGLIKNSPKNIQRLLKLAKTSNANPKVAIAAGNAMTILTAARVAFANEDFSYNNFPRSNLSGGNFQNAEVRNGDCERVKLNLATLINVDFTGTKLTGADFGEFPNIKVSDNGQSCIWFDENNNLMAAGWRDNDEAIKIYNYNKQKITKILDNLEDAKGNACFISWDGCLLLYINELDFLQLYNIKKNKLISTIDAYAVGFVQNYDQQFLAIKSDYDEIFIVNPIDGKIIHRLGTKSEYNILRASESLAFSKNDLYLASSQIHKGQISIWQLPKFNLFLTLKCKSNNTTEEENNQDQVNEVYGIAFNPQATLLAAGYMNGNILLWEMPSGNYLRQLDGHDHVVYTLDFSSEGNLLVSGSDDCTVRLWNANTGTFLALLLESPGPIEKVRFNQDSTYIAVENEGSLTIVPVSNRQPSLKQGHTHVIETVCFSHDGNWLATSGGDCTICIWSVDQFCLITKTKVDIRIQSLKFSSDDRELYAIDENDSEVYIYDTQTLQVINTHLLGSQIKNSYVSKPAFISGSRNIIYEQSLTVHNSGNEKESVNIVNIENSYITFKWHTLPVDAREGTMAFSASSDNSHLAVAYFNNWIRVVNTKDYQHKSFYIPIDKKSGKNNKSKIELLCFNHNSQLLVAATEDGIIYFFDLNSKQQNSFKTIKFNDKTSIDKIIFIKNDQIIIVAISNCISIWSINGYCYSYTQAHISRINDFDTNRAQNVLATVSNDIALTVWKITSDFCLNQIWTSRPLLNCANARFSLEGNLDPLQESLVEEHGGIIIRQKMADTNKVMFQKLTSIDKKFIKIFFNLRRATNTKKENLRKIEAAKLYHSFQIKPKTIIKYQWDEEKYSNALAELNLVTGLDFRSFPQTTDNRLIDALIIVECFSIMENIIKKLKELDIPNAVYIDGESFCYLVITNVNNFSLHVLQQSEMKTQQTKHESKPNSSISASSAVALSATQINSQPYTIGDKDSELLINTTSFFTNSSTAKWKTFPEPLLVDKYKGHHVRFFTMDSTEAAKAREFTERLQKAGFDAELKKAKNDKPSVVVDLTTSMLVLKKV